MTRTTEEYPEIRRALVEEHRRQRAFDSAKELSILYRELNHKVDGVIVDARKIEKYLKGVDPNEVKE